MFEFLSKAATEQAISVASHTIRLIEWRHTLDNDLIGAAAALTNRLSSAEKKLTLRALSEIQQAENTPLHKLPEFAADKYVWWLAGIATARAEQTLSKADLKRGREILAEWKGQTLEDELQREMAERDENLLANEWTKPARPPIPEQYLELSEQELRAETARLKESLFRLQFKLARGEVDAVKSIRQKKKSLRLINTIMRQKAVGEHEES